MDNFSKNSLYQKIILKLLRKKSYTVDELLNALNECLDEDYNCKAISRRSFDRAKKLLIGSGYRIISQKINGTNYFVLEESPENTVLTEEEQLTFPLLLGLLETERKMNSVEWLKMALRDEFNFSEKDLKSYPYFVHVQPSLNDQDQLLLLSGRIIDYIKKGQAITFLYRKNTAVEFKQVAPLQIRYYDNRYYLFGSSYDENTGQPTNLLQTYTIDLIEGKLVYPAIDESDETELTNKPIYFDYDDLYKKTRLEELLNNSLGVWYDWKENKLKTFKLKFTGWAMGIIRNKKIHPSQLILVEAKDYLLVEITVWDNPETNNYFSRFMDMCELLN